MPRPITTLAIFFIAFNVFASALMASGVAGLIGVNAAVGGDQAVQNSQSESDDIRTGNGLGGTLFGMYNVLADGLSTIVGVVFPGLSMLQRAGVPGFITNIILAPIFSFITAVGFISFLRGFDL